MRPARTPTSPSLTPPTRSARRVKIRSCSRSNLLIGRSVRAFVEKIDQCFDAVEHQQDKRHECPGKADAENSAPEGQYDMPACEDGHDGPQQYIRAARQQK